MMESIKDKGRKKSEIINITNDLATFEKTHQNIRKLGQCKSFSMDSFRVALASYAEQYVSGVDREEFFSCFCEHAMLDYLLEMIKKLKNPNLFVIVMKALSIISFNLKDEKETSFFFSRHALAQLLEIQLPYSKSSQTVEVYIQFLKSLALRFKEHHNWRLFYNIKQPIFPLMWKVLVHYNRNDQLTRTTIRSILLEVSRINDFSVKCYLNNFPFVLFFGHFAMYVTDHMKECSGQNTRLMIDIVGDEFNFVNDFIGTLEPSTKAFMLNSLIHYPLRFLWSSIVNDNKKSSPKTILSLILETFFNLNSDATMLMLAFQIFFQRTMFQKNLEYLSSKPKEMKFYSYSEEERPKVENCKKTIQQHSKKIYNQFSMQVRKVGQHIVVNKKYNKTFNIINKPINISKQIIGKVIAPWSWDGWLIGEINALSEVIGVQLQLNQPVGQNSNNIYLENKEIKWDQAAKVQNPFYKNILDIINKDQQALNVYLKIQFCLLNNPNLDEIHPKIAKTFIRESPQLLKIISRNKSVEGILHTMEAFELCKQILQDQELESSIQSVKNELNQLMREASKSLLQTEFTDWENYLQVFQGHERYMEKFEQENKGTTELDYDKSQEDVPVSDQQLKIHFYSLMRRVITSFSEQEHQSVRAVVQAEENNLVEQQSGLSQIKFSIGVQEYNSTVDKRVFRIINGRTILEGPLKRLNIRPVSSTKLQLYMLPNMVSIEFESEAQLSGFCEQTSLLKQRVQQTQISIISLLVQNPIQL